MKLAKDPLSAIILNLPKENLKLLEQRFSELYFQSIKQKYLISLTICRPKDGLPLPQLVDCTQYDEALRAQYDAMPISDGSSFFYLSNYKDRKSTRLNSSHQIISYAVFCLKKK